MIEKTDAVILAACTKVSHSLQRATGITNYFIAKIGIVLMAVVVMLDFPNYVFQFLRHKTLLSELCLDLILLIIAVYRSLQLTRAEEALSVGNNVKPAGLIDCTQSVFWRFMWLIWSIIDAIVVCLTPHGRYWLLDVFDQMGFSVGVAIFYYFVAVNPLSPRKSKIRNWLEKLVRGRTLVPISVTNEN